MYGMPNEDPGVGDIEKLNYIFLGNYVDFVFNSLELILNIIR